MNIMLGANPNWHVAKRHSSSVSYVVNMYLYSKVKPMTQNVWPSKMNLYIYIYIYIYIYVNEQKPGFWEYVETRPGFIYFFQITQDLFVDAGK